MYQHTNGWEVHIAVGLPGFQCVGWPSGEQRHLRDRVRIGVQRSGLDWPMRRITVHHASASHEASPDNIAALTEAMTAALSA